MDLFATLNKLTKWRTVFAGWQLGTRSIDDPECQAVRDHREVTILLRAEVSAITAVLLTKGVCTQEEFNRTLGVEARQLDQDYANRFPGFTSSAEGIVIDPARAVKTTKGWRP